MKHLGQNMSSLFRQNKLPPNLAAENNRHFLPEGFCELGLREQLSSSCFPLRTRWRQWHPLQAFWGPQDMALDSPPTTVMQGRGRGESRGPFL